MYARIKQYAIDRPRLKKIVGIFLVFIGFVALVTPLTPGGFLLVVGLELLGIRLLFVERIQKRLPGRKRTPSAETSLFKEIE